MNGSWSSLDDLTAPPHTHTHHPGYKDVFHLQSAVCGAGAYALIWLFSIRGNSCPPVVYPEGVDC